MMDCFNRPARERTEVTAMRLIDADQMAVDESEAYMSAQVQITDDLNWLVNFSAHSKIQKLIADTPTVDAVPVVRCKDCMHYLIVDEFEGGKRYMCKVNHFSYINSDGDMHYCSYGERKEDKDG